MNTKQTVTEAELQRREAECERSAVLFSSRHRAKKARRKTTKQPTFVLRTSSIQPS